MSHNLKGTPRLSSRLTFRLGDAFPDIGVKPRRVLYIVASEAITPHAARTTACTEDVIDRLSATFLADLSAR